MPNDNAEALKVAELAKLTVADWGEIAAALGARLSVLKAGRDAAFYEDTDEYARWAAAYRATDELARRVCDARCAAAALRADA